MYIQYTIYDNAYRRLWNVFQLRLEGRRRTQGAESRSGEENQRKEKGLKKNKKINNFEGGELDEGVWRNRCASASLHWIFSKRLVSILLCVRRDQMPVAIEHHPS